MEQTEQTHGTAGHGHRIVQQAHIEALVQLHLGLRGVDLIRKIQSTPRMTRIHEHRYIDTSWHALDHVCVQLVIHNLSSSFEIDRDQGLFESTYRGKGRQLVSHLGIIIKLRYHVVIDTLVFL